MSTNTTGAGENLAHKMVEQVINGGATIHLFGGGDTANYSDGSADVDSKSGAEESVAEADYSVNTPADFSGGTELVVDVEVDFGATDIGTVDDIVVQNDTDGDLWLVGDEPNNPELTGEDVVIEAGTTIYEFGNV